VKEKIREKRSQKVKEKETSKTIRAWPVVHYLYFPFFLWELSIRFAKSRTYPKAQSLWDILENDNI